jgi:hypothetical protein
VDHLSPPCGQGQRPQHKAVAGREQRARGRFAGRHGNLAGGWRSDRFTHSDAIRPRVYDGPSKRQPGERFAAGRIDEVLPKAIEHLVGNANSIIDSWKPKP